MHFYNSILKSWDAAAASKQRWFDRADAVNRSGASTVPVWERAVRGVGIANPRKKISDRGRTRCGRSDIRLPGLVAAISLSDSRVSALHSNRAKANGDHTANRESIGGSFFSLSADRETPSQTPGFPPAPRNTI